MKKLVIILGLILLALTACAQNEWKYPLYVGTNGGTGGAVTLYGATSGSLTLRVPAIAGTTIFEFPSTLGTNGYVLSTNGAGVLSWVAGGAGSMVYPAAGIGLSDGTQWLGSIANNSANWNTAYSWGNHALVGYVTGTPWTSMGYVTGTPWTSMGYLTSETSHTDVVVDGDFTNVGIMLRGATSGTYSILTNNSTNWNTAYSWVNTNGANAVTAYGWGNHASAGYAPLNSPTFTGAVTIPLPFTAGTTSISSIENYSTENYGATGTGDIVLSTGPTLTTVNITDVIHLTPTANPPSGATEGMIYADTDHHLYYYNGTGWIQLDN